MEKVNHEISKGMTETQIIDYYDGKQDEELVMIINNVVYDSFQFANEFEYFSKKIQKAGYNPTHRIEWTYKKGYSRVCNNRPTLYRMNVKYIDLKTGEVTEC